MISMLEILSSIRYPSFKSSREVEPRNHNGKIRWFGFTVFQSYLLRIGMNWPEARLFWRSASVDGRNPRPSYSKHPIIYMVAYMSGGGSPDFWTIDIWLEDFGKLRHLRGAPCDFPGSVNGWLMEKAQGVFPWPKKTQEQTTVLVAT